MSFPEFDTNDFNHQDEIQVEEMHPGQPNNFMMHNAPNDNFFNVQTNADQGYNWAQNVPTGDDYGNFGIDEEEEKRIQARKKEEDERRSKIISLMNEEIRVKQEFRDKAREYLDNFAEIRNKALNKRQEFNKQNEIEFLENRKAVKEGKKNPWERVVENIEIKESDYKGTKDVSRMRSVILVRKGDMMKMK